MGTVDYGSPKTGKTEQQRSGIRKADKRLRVPLNNRLID
jgi:hypothetical protein